MKTLACLHFQRLLPGLLTGKYQNNKVPVGSRKSISPELGGRATERVWLAVDKYMEISAKYQIDPVHLSIAWCSSRPFMCSTIIGATNVDQLSHILGSQDVEISEDCLVDIDNAHKKCQCHFSIVEGRTMLFEIFLLYLKLWLQIYG